MLRGKLSGLMICALVLVAVGGRGYAADIIVKASAPIKGEGRFYKAGEHHLLFSGYFQGNVELEGQRVDLNGAGLVCPGMMEVYRTARTQQGEGIRAHAGILFVDDAAVADHEDTLRARFRMYEIVGKAHLAARQCQTTL